MLPCGTCRQSILRAKKLNLPTVGCIVSCVDGGLSRNALPLLLRLLGPNDGLVAAYDGLARANDNLPAANDK